MPLILPLPAPGRPFRLGRYVMRWACQCPKILTSCHSPRQLFTSTPPLVWNSVSFGTRDFHNDQILRIILRNYSNGPTLNDGIQNGPIDTVSNDLHGVEDEKFLQDQTYHRPFCPRPSRRRRKVWRQSRPARVLASIQSSAMELYWISPFQKTDLSHTNPRRIPGNNRRWRRRRLMVLAQSNHAWLPEPVSLYSILARFLETRTAPEVAGSEFQLTTLEFGLLHAKGYTQASVEAWASCLLEPRAEVAAKIFESGVELPPFFLLLLYLRRKRLRAFTLGIIMRHVDHRKNFRSISWSGVKLLVIRFLRHARELLPESIPWIASLFVTEASRLHKLDGESHTLSIRMLSDVTHFCNTLLLLLSLPITLHPIMSSSYQERAQFQVLQYMANTSPAIQVNRKGFRSIARTQLAHSKTAQEREWAELKSASWPPWKENRTAMDEDKSYEFGASRASKVLHRMHEAGYARRAWEDVAEIYAGWDTDSSPTIQTRTSFPRFSTQYRDVTHLRSLLWAGRIRATRTRREAWACFLAYEATKARASLDVYLAMFEKLYYPIADKSLIGESRPELSRAAEQRIAHLLPGDMKELLPDSTSPLHQVFISEPVPIYRQLYGRMSKALGRPSGRLLAFLLETSTKFDLTLDALATTQGGIALLVAGQHDQASIIQKIPGYLFTAFIRFLCRFGHFHQPPRETPRLISSEEHAERFKTDRQYLLEYANALLMEYRPKYRLAWTAFVDKLVQHWGSKQAGDITRYRIIYQLINTMDQVDVDIDDELFRLLCTATFYAAQTVNDRSTSTESAHFVFVTGWPLLRSHFNRLVGVHADVQLSNSFMGSKEMVSLHFPGPAELHAYVRALGILRDYEGLYSFSIWLARHRAEVIARAEARNTGSRLMFRLLVALRAAVEGRLGGRPGQESARSVEVAELVKRQIDGVPDWGGWPSQEYVDMYLKGQLKTSMPSVGGR